VRTFSKTNYLHSANERKKKKKKKKGLKVGR
jgi:hypothetical protein